ncbi:hypothetical protein PEPNEM18_00534 [Aedoeadaptatus nemausensis]|uniref:Uncharacterized protein n=1 Tax=Aedoeadaptatus nemausensis TaxID=2582829 RepID=A0A6V6Y038_9FIRM|nr:hypothetical protein [Peptoniphilus nemausensis]CAC9925439.1 hypothetical protein PEPNEM18_00534 [Peptoniphilus nemausensis]
MRRKQFLILALIQLFVAIFAGDILIKYFFNREIKMNVFFALAALIIALSSSYHSYKKYKEIK